MGQFNRARPIQGGREESSDREGTAESQATRSATGESGGSAIENTPRISTMRTQGQNGPLIGRKLESQRTLEILCRRRKEKKQSPVRRRRSRRGQKPAIAEGLARMIVENEVPDVLLDATMYALDMGSPVAGTKYRGDIRESA